MFKIMVTEDTGDSERFLPKPKVEIYKSDNEYMWDMEESDDSIFDGNFGLTLGEDRSLVLSPVEFTDADTSVSTFANGNLKVRVRAVQFRAKTANHTAYAV